MAGNKRTWVRQAYFEAELHAQPNDSNLRLLAGPRKGCS